LPQQASAVLSRNWAQGHDKDWDDLRKLPVDVVELDAHVVKGYKEMCLAAGMDGYATKPINKKDLLALVDKWCGSAGAKTSL
jgi:CheY-like chemotaxis protein